MNLLLLTAEEGAASTIRLDDHRARHVREVLRSVAGDTVRVGILDGPQGTAVIRDTGPSSVTLECRFADETEPRSEDTLLLAVPRPVVLQRCLAQAAALGYGRIVLFRSRRVDKSHLASKVLRHEETRRHLIAGLAQARRTRVPEVRFFPLFKPFVEDVIDDLLGESVPEGQRFVAHPAAERDVADARPDRDKPIALAVGPEGGFIPYEVSALVAQGFAAVRAGDHPLRVETALAFVTGQLAVLRRR